MLSYTVRNSARAMTVSSVGGTRSYLLYSMILFPSSTWYPEILDPADIWPRAARHTTRHPSTSDLTEGENRILLITASLLSANVS